MKYNFVPEGVEKAALDKDLILNIVQPSKGKKDEKAEPAPEKEKKTAKSIIQEAVEKGNNLQTNKIFVKIVVKILGPVQKYQTFIFHYLNQ